MAILCYLPKISLFNFDVCLLKDIEYGNITNQLLEILDKHALVKKKYV